MAFGSTALLAVPLHVNGAVIGVDVVSKVGGFTEDDVPIMSVFANQAAMAHRARPVARAGGAVGRAGGTATVGP